MEIAAAALAGTAAIAAYVDAKYHIRNDLSAGSLSYTAAKAQKFLAEKEAQSRLLLYHVFEGHAENNPDRLFLEFEGRSWTYKQFFTSITRVGNWLMNDLGIVRGETIALDGPNSAEYLMLWFALEAVGAAVAFINCNLTGNSLTHCVKLSKSRYVLVDGDIENLIVPCAEDLSSNGVTTVLYSADSIAKLHDTTSLPEERWKDIKATDVRRSLAIKALLFMCSRLIYTSGTTGLPKGVMQATGRVHMTAHRMAEYLKLTPDDKFYTCLPLYHGAGQSLCTTPSVVAGSSIRLGKKFSHQRFWPEVYESRATRLQYVGELCRYLVNAPVHPLERKHRVQEAWGNGMRPDVWERFRTRFNIPVIHELYAATDGMGATFNYNRGAFSRNAIGVRGLIWHWRNKNTEIRARIDPDTEEIVRGDDGYVEVANVNEPGEVLHKIDPQMKSTAFRGYFGNEEASEKRWMYNVFEPNDLWFRSGDVMREDAEGRVFFVDRLGDTFRWRSENVSTNEVGDVVGTHPQIAEVNVYGVSVPNADGRAGCAMLVLHPSATLDNLDLKGLAQHFTSKLPRYAVPIFLRVAPEISYTGTMKMQKGQAKKEGVDLDLIDRSATKDRFFWLPPGADSYQPYGKDEWEALKTGKVKL